MPRAHHQFLALPHPHSLSPATIISPNRHRHHSHRFLRHPRHHRVPCPMRSPQTHPRQPQVHTPPRQRTILHRWQAPPNQYRRHPPLTPMTTKTTTTTTTTTTMAMAILSLTPTIMLIDTTNAAIDGLSRAHLQRCYQGSSVDGRTQCTGAGAARRGIAASVLTRKRNLCRSPRQLLRSTRNRRWLHRLPMARRRRPCRRPHLRERERTRTRNRWAYGVRRAS
jgi:hypothetical protein